MNMSAGSWIAKQNLALTAANANFGALSGSSVAASPGTPLPSATAGTGSNFVGGAGGFNGITSVAFPSKMLGVAVGLSAGNAQISQCPPSSVISAATCQASWQGAPNILITVDQGATWQVRHSPGDPYCESLSSELFWHTVTDELVTCRR